MRGLSEDPNQTVSYAGNPHLSSIIYAQNSDSDNFPVKGYLVGGTTSIWSYNACQEDEFDLPGYEKIFTSPESNKRLGILQKIELDAKRCNIEQVTVVTPLSALEGVGRDDTSDSLFTVSGRDEQMSVYDPTPNVHDIVVPLGDWETFLSSSFEQCAARSADSALYSLDEPIFEEEDSLEYQIGSGAYQVSFKDWAVTENLCNMNFEYMVRETGGSNVFNLDESRQSELNIVLETQDQSNDGKSYSISVLALTPNYQCAKKQFTVSLFSEDVEETF